MIAESYERIHRSNLIGMGIAPLQYLTGENTDTLKLSGKESFSIDIPDDIKPGQNVTVKVCAFNTLPFFYAPSKLSRRYITAINNVR